MSKCLNMPKFIKLYIEVLESINTFKKLGIFRHLDIGYKNVLYYCYTYNMSYLMLSFVFAIFYYHFGHKILIYKKCPEIGVVFYYYFLNLPKCLRMPKFIKLYIEVLESINTFIKLGIFRHLDIGYI